MNDDKIIYESELTLYNIFKNVCMLVPTHRQFLYCVGFFLVKNVFIYFYLTTQKLGEEPMYGKFFETTIGETATLYVLLVIIFVGYIFVNKKKLLKDYTIVKDGEIAKEGEQ